MLIAVPVSAGELVDKITILEIKSRKVKNNAKLRNINSELNILNLQLTKLFKSCPSKSPEIKKFKNKLRNVNLRLWRIEDSIRKNETKNKFGNEFIKLARNIYKLNDERFKIKQNINLITDSFIKEEKLYK